MEPFTVHVTDDEIDQLRRRLADTRWPDTLAPGWDYGSDLEVVRDVCAYWQHDFDWTGFVARRNAVPQFTTEIDGQRIHFLHQRSPEPKARPLLLTHGWPGSIAEFDAVIGPLTDPQAHGGAAEDAFHVVVPSLPGYGYSGPTAEPGWDPRRVTRAFARLMTDLGYQRFYAQGGDWGSLVTMLLASNHADQVVGVHVNLLTPSPPRVDDPMEGVTEAEAAGLNRMEEFLKTGVGYQAIQSTKPQTLAFGLNDSPAGLAAWIIEKFHSWSDCDGDLLATLSHEQILDTISIYWLTGTIGSSMRLYYETLGPTASGEPVSSQVPIGHARYPMEIYQSPRVWAEARHHIVHWADMPRGGHFAALEVPDLFVDDVRACFRVMPPI